MKTLHLHVPTYYSRNSAIIAYYSINWLIKTLQDFNIITAVLFCVVWRFNVDIHSMAQSHLTIDVFNIPPHTPLYTVERVQEVYTAVSTKQLTDCHMESGVIIQLSENGLLTATHTYSHRHEEIHNWIRTEDSVIKALQFYNFVMPHCVKTTISVRCKHTESRGHDRLQGAWHNVSRAHQPVKNRFILRGFSTVTGRW